MKTHTNDFKNEIKKFGRQLDSKITFTMDEELVELGPEELNSITPHYEGAILKSVMRQLDIDSNELIPEGTVINYQFGVKVGNSYEYLDFGNYVVYKVEKQEDMRSYKITCYDKMLYAMKEYKKLESKNLYDVSKSINGYINNNGTITGGDANLLTDYIEVIPNEKYTISVNTQFSNLGYALFDEDATYVSRQNNNNKTSVTITIPNDIYYLRVWFNYNGAAITSDSILQYQPVIEKGETRTNYIPFFQYPVTIRNYISTLCYNLGLQFKNETETFANYDQEILEELYLDSEGNSLDYTFRDVLDELAAVTGSTICINEDDDELEIRYINDTEDTIDEEYLKDINVNFGQKYGPINSIVLSRAAESDNVYLRDETSVTQNGLCEIKIKENQILNGNNRSDFLADLLTALDGLEYYINDYSSPGITYYDLCDLYNIQIDNTTYKCIMFNDEINVTQGLEENVYTEMPEESETDYSKADKTDRRINQTYLIVDKQNGQINSVVSQTTELNSKLYGDGTEENQGDISRLETSITQKADSIEFNTYKEKIDNIETNGVAKVENTTVKINDEGLSVSTSGSKIKTTMTNNEFKITDSGGNKLAYFGYDEQNRTSIAEMDNLTVTNYFVAGNHRVEKYGTNKERTGWFYVGGRV